MTPWMIFVLAVLAIIIGAMFRNPRPPRWLAQPEEDEEEAPRRPVPPPLPRRRLPPPPLPRARLMDVAEAIPVAVIPEAKPAPAPAPPPAPTVERRPLSRTALQVGALLRSRQTLRAAILLREVLDPPLCRRRGLGGAGPQERNGQ